MWNTDLDAFTINSVIIFYICDCKTIQMHSAWSTTN